MNRLARSSLLVLLATAGCFSQTEDIEAGSGAVASEAPLKLCAAVRGNGQNIGTHFAALSRIIEHYGVIDGMAGGSSGSITTFLYESVLMNRAVDSCGGEACSDAERAARVALAVKSIQGYGETVVGSDEGVAVRALIDTVATLKEAVEARGIAAIGAEDAEGAATKLREVLSIPEVRALVNPELFAMLDDVPHLAFNVGEIVAAIKDTGSFKVTDNRLLFRTGVLDWNTIAGLFGRVGDFYAGYEPADQHGYAAWLDACATKSVGKPWDEVAKIEIDGSTCGATFGNLVGTFRETVRASGASSKRLSEKVGDASSPLRKLVSTAVLEGAALPAYEAARAAYLAGTPGNIPSSIDFDDVKFGYWGSNRDLDTVRANLPNDPKSKKMTSLGNAAWKEILASSPAEPGLSRLVALPDGRISAGGWSDLTPTIVLKSMGCEQVVLVTREGDDAGFNTQVARELGMNEAGWTELYDLANPTSSLTASLEHADAVWCTNWNAFSTSQQREMAADAWHAPLEVHARFEGAPVLRPYEGATSRVGKPGCTPGVSGGARFPSR